MKRLFLLVTAICYLHLCFGQITIVLQPDSASGKDALLHGLSSEVDKNYGKNPQFASTAGTFGGEFAATRSIISFNLSQIPANATINAAKLSLYAWDTNTGLLQHYGSNAGWLERVTSAWNEFTVTWNSQPSTTTLNRVELPISTSGTQNYLDLNVTQLVSDMIANPTSSYGFMLKLQTEEAYRRLNFCSSDHPIQALHPKLEIQYTAPLNDSVLTLQPDPETGKDALLHGLSSEVNVNRGNNPQLAASAWTFGGEPGIVRSVIEFNLKQIPPRKAIESAKLSLYAWDSTIGIAQNYSGDGSNACWVERIISNWDESTVTWNNQPRTTTYNRASLPMSTSATQNYLDIDVTKIAQDIVNYPDSSFGFMLKLQNETYYRSMNFCSSDHPNAEFRPKLVIKFAKATKTNDVYSLKDAIAVYPNPVREVLNIDMSANNLPENASIILYNQLGQQVKQLPIKKGITSIDTGYLNNGIYLYKISDASNSLLKIGKIMVSK
jgi:hypothetical protein